jgi:GTP-binding protein
LKVEFVLSASAPEQFPADGLREIAFLGRSNVGKSSLINALTGQKGLAFTSSTPGRTQTINFYRVDEKMYFVDLPGYGYAKVPRGMKDDWKRLIERYLVDRDRLESAFLILDARRGWMEKDLELKQWLDHHERHYLVVVTKMDKLNQTEQRRTLGQIAEVSPSPLPFSAVTGRGAREIWQAIQKTHQLLPSLGN